MDQDWWLNFKKRNPVITRHRVTPLQHERDSATNHYLITDTFQRLEKIMKENNITSPEQIWNLDETPYEVDTPQLYTIDIKNKNNNIK